MFVLIAGFAGSNTLEEAQVLMMGACVMDTLTPLFKMHGLKEEEAKASSSHESFALFILF